VYALHPQYTGVVDAVMSCDLKMKLSSEHPVNCTYIDFLYCAFTNIKAHGVRNFRYGIISAGTAVVSPFVNLINASCQCSLRIEERTQRNSLRNACISRAHTLDLVIRTIKSSGSQPFPTRGPPDKFCLGFYIFLEKISDDLLSEN